MTNSVFWVKTQNRTEQKSVSAQETSTKFIFSLIFDKNTTLVNKNHDDNGAKSIQIVCKRDFNLFQILCI